MHSIALKILNTEQEGTAYNVCIPNISSEDGYIIADIANSYTEALKDEGVEPVMEVNLEAICDGKVIQMANRDCKIFTAKGQESLDKIIDAVEGLAIKYQKQLVLYKQRYALLV